jgi:hypothetical protein
MLLLLLPQPLLPPLLLLPLLLLLMHAPSLIGRCVASE